MTLRPSPYTPSNRAKRTGRPQAHPASRLGLVRSRFREPPEALGSCRGSPRRASVTLPPTRY